MKTNILKKNINAAKFYLPQLRFKSHLLDRYYGIYSEDYFLNILHLERKKTERSNKPFLLMLLDINRCEMTEKNNMVNKITQVLFFLTRETDIKGWYKHNSMIGVIFTDMDDIEVLREKIYSNLSYELAAEQLNKIEISFHVFPEKDNGNKPDISANLTLYPDIKEKNGKMATLFIKRFIDVVGSVIGLIIFSPLFIIISLCIRLTSKGPIFFRQERVGQFGKRFNFLKFRTMYVNNDSSIHQEYIKKFILEQGSYDAKNGDRGKENVYKIKDDPRVTPIGRFLRKSSMDELPQFINVLNGEMSLIGPRPPLPYEVKIYNIWHKRRITEVKPGITGLWQGNGRSSTTFDEMVRLDIRYIKEWSIWLDIKILFQTPRAVLVGKGAY